MTGEPLALELTHVFDAPVDLVYRMWSEAEHMRRWGCPEGFSVVYSEIDFRVGGQWRSCMRSPDGTDYRLQGEYLEIVPNEKIVNTSAWLDEEDNPVQQTVITLNFRAVGDKTELTLQQATFETVSSRDSHLEGWVSSLANLATHLNDPSNDA